MHWATAASAIYRASLLKLFSSGPKFDRFEPTFPWEWSGGFDEDAPNLVGFFKWEAGFASFALASALSCSLWYFAIFTLLKPFPSAPFFIGGPMHIRTPFPFNASKCSLTRVYDPLYSFLHSQQTHANDPPPWIFPTVDTYFQSGDFGSTLGPGVDSISCATSSASWMAELEVAMNDDDAVNGTEKENWQIPLYHILKIQHGCMHTTNFCVLCFAKIDAGP